MFVSGPHVSCYRAVSLADGSFSGVRCVLYANLVHSPEVDGVAFVWYGEGTGPAGPYRHFGEAFRVAPGGDDSRALIAQAACLVGNGEREEPFLRLGIEVSAPAGEIPARLVVTGDRPEEWTLAPDGSVPEYRPLPRHIARAGPNLHEYTVRKRDGTPGHGVRCLLTSGSWLGAGRWLDLTYLHLGTYVGTGTGAVRFGAADICATTRYCGLVPWGEISVQDDDEAGRSVRRVTGAWSEEWHLRHPAAGWRPDPRIADLTVLG
jgi:hypothetical protein